MALFTLEDLDCATHSRAGKGTAALWPPLGSDGSLLSPTEMLRDIIREYTDVYPEIIERACFVLEKVRRQPWGTGIMGKVDFKDSWGSYWEFRASLREVSVCLWVAYTRCCNFMVCFLVPVEIWDSAERN